MRLRLCTAVTVRPVRRAATFVASVSTNSSSALVHARPFGTSPRASHAAAATRILAFVWAVCLVPRRFRWAWRIAAATCGATGVPLNRSDRVCRRSSVHGVARPFARTAANHSSAPYAVRSR